HPNCIGMQSQVMRIDPCCWSRDPLGVSGSVRHLPIEGRGELESHVGESLRLIFDKGLIENRRLFREQPNLHIDLCFSESLDCFSTHFWIRIAMCYPDAHKLLF